MKITVFLTIAIMALSLIACSTTTENVAIIHPETDEKFEEFEKNQQQTTESFTAIHQKTEDKLDAPEQRVQQTTNDKLEVPEQRMQKDTDVFIGHAYYRKCPYFECGEEHIFARLLFEKTKNGWRTFPNSKDVGSNPDDLKQSYKLFPREIKWNIFNNNLSLIGKETVEINKHVEWWINVGAAQMRLDPEIIKQHVDKRITFYDMFADLILSTNENVTFSKFKTRKTTDVKIFESAIKNMKKTGNSDDPSVTIEKRATIYSIENVDVIAVLDIEHFYYSDGELGWNETDSVVFAKNGDKWEFIFDGENFDDDGSDMSFSLKTIADFDNDGKRECIFILVSGVNGFGYVLWQEGIAKPLAYKYYSH